MKTELPNSRRWDLHAWSKAGSGAQLRISDERERRSSGGKGFRQAHAGLHWVPILSWTALIVGADFNAQLASKVSGSWGVPRNVRFGQGTSSATGKLSELGLVILFRGTTVEVGELLM